MPEKETTLSRRAFLQVISIGAAGGAFLGDGVHPAGTPAYASQQTTNGTGIAGVACVSSQVNKSPRLDFISLADGRHLGSFFDRDIGFSRDRRTVFVTNPADKTLTAIDVRGRQNIGQICLPAKPEWLKVLTA